VSNSASVSALVITDPAYLVTIREKGETDSLHVTGRFTEGRRQILVRPLRSPGDPEKGHPSNG
jgi:hypothetical protein